jgi:hypothetical protein
MPEQEGQPDRDLDAAAGLVSGFEQSDGGQQQQAVHGQRPQQRGGGVGAAVQGEVALVLVGAVGGYGRDDQRAPAAQPHFAVSVVWPGGLGSLGHRPSPLGRWRDSPRASG